MLSVVARKSVGGAKFETVKYECRECLLPCGDINPISLKQTDHSVLAASSGANFGASPLQGTVFSVLTPSLTGGASPALLLVVVFAVLETCQLHDGRRSEKGRKED